MSGFEVLVFNQGKQYQLEIRPKELYDITDKNRSYEVACIYDNKNQRRVIGIIFDKDCRKMTGKDVMICVPPEGYESDEGLVLISKKIYDLMDTNFNVFVAMMYHEAGHFINGDLRKSGEQYSFEQRSRAILEGVVQQEELNADAFACRWVGKSKMINMIDYAIKSRKERNEDPYVKQLAIKEFELRKRAIQKLK